MERMTESAIGLLRSASTPWRRREPMRSARSKGDLKHFGHRRRARRSRPRPKPRSAGHLLPRLNERGATASWSRAFQNVRDIEPPAATAICAGLQYQTEGPAAHAPQQQSDMARGSRMGHRLLRAGVASKTALGTESHDLPRRPGRRATSSATGTAISPSASSRAPAVWPSPLMGRVWRQAANPGRQPVGRVETSSKPAAPRSVLEWALGR